MQENKKTTITKISTRIVICIMVLFLLSVIGCAIAIKCGATGLKPTGRGVFFYFSAKSHSRGSWLVGHPLALPLKRGGGLGKTSMVQEGEGQAN